MVKDELTKWFLKNNFVLTVAKTTNLINQSIKIHNLCADASIILGRALTMSSIMGSRLKYKDDKITSIINNDNIHMVTVVKDNKVKGYIQTDLNKSNKNEVLNEGKLTVIHSDSVGSQYVGEVESCGEITEDFTRYYTRSLQQTCFISLNAIINDGRCINGGGFLVEMLPGATERSIIEMKKTIDNLKEINILQDISTKEFVNSFFGHLEPKFYELIEPHLKCDCNTNRITKVIQSLPEKDRTFIRNNKGEIEVKCDFCNKIHIVI